ncbi:MAG: NADH-quinone oxidoreductase subunit J [Phycisphaerales bacterium]|nr:NADH-quinone oxidoreductase subunit J [Phycisphaerales bacterium]
MLSQQLVYWAYGVGGFGALCVYFGLPKEGRPERRGLFVLLLAVTLGGLVLLFDRLLGESANRFVFSILALLGVGGAVRVVTHPRPVYSALYFILVVLSTAALIIYVGAEFLGVALVIVYAGAILVTYVFVIMLSQQSTEATESRFASVLDYDRSAREPVWAVLAGFILMATVAAIIVKRDWSDWDEVSAAAMTEKNTLELGKMLMTEFAISVELAGVLLMVAMIGAIAVAKKRIPHASDAVESPPRGEVGKTVDPF